MNKDGDYTLTDRVKELLHVHNKEYEEYKRMADPLKGKICLAKCRIQIHASAPSFGNVSAITGLLLDSNGPMSNDDIAYRQDVINRSGSEAAWYQRQLEALPGYGKWSVYEESREEWHRKMRRKMEIASIAAVFSSPFALGGGLSLVDHAHAQHKSVPAYVIESTREAVKKTVHDIRTYRATPALPIERYNTLQCAAEIATLNRRNQDTIFINRQVTRVRAAADTLGGLLSEHPQTAEQAYDFEARRVHQGEAVSDAIYQLYHGTGRLWHELPELIPSCHKAELSLTGQLTGRFW